MAKRVQKGKRRRRNSYMYKNLKCSLCESGIEGLSYKDVYRLKKFVTSRGRILPRKRTGTCAKHQKQVTEAVKLARHVALLPFADAD